MNVSGALWKHHRERLLFSFQINDRSFFPIAFHTLIITMTDTEAMDKVKSNKTKSSNKKATDEEKDGEVRDQFNR